jgi:leucyl-tRNA synthetase
MLASYKFIQKLWGLHKKIINNLSKNNNSKTDSDEISKFTNQLINKINGNLEKFNYNVFIANMYETYNFLSQKINNPINKKILFENYRKVLSVISPIIPHFASECLGDLKLNTFQKWPDVDENMLESETVEYVIQINGKKRSIINSKKDIDEKTLIEKIKKDQKIGKFLDGSNIIRSIFVKNKLINLIIK